MAYERDLQEAEKYYFHYIYSILRQVGIAFMDLERVKSFRQCEGDAHSSSLHLCGLTVRELENMTARALVDRGAEVLCIWGEECEL
jgi:hypothetical protein